MELLRIQMLLLEINEVDIDLKRFMNEQSLPHMTKNREKDECNYLFCDLQMPVMDG